VKRWPIGWVMVAIVVGVPVLGTRADGHPSDLNTLTLDLILDRGGVSLIDAAANHATYDDVPTAAQRGDIATAVLDALGVSRDSTEVDATSSLLYHEVGFTIWLHQPLANTAVPGQVQIDTGSLQQLAAASVGRLELDVCRVATPDQTFELQASIPPTAPDPAGAGAATDRLDCGSWTLQGEDVPVSITARAVATHRESARRKSMHLLRGTHSQLDPSSVTQGPVALPRAALHARATGATDPSGRLIADAFVFTKEGTAIELIVPPAWRGKLTVGADGVRADRATIPAGKRYSAYGWDQSRHNFWIDEPACAPLIVRTPKTKRTIHIGIGVSCP
jgi:hypothetical protein